MKKLSLVLNLILLVVFNVSAQQFEGEIIYSIKYQSKNPKISDTQMEFLFGNWQSYSIKGNNYKSAGNGKLLVWQMYRAKDNKVYTKGTNTETIFWNDASVQKDEVIKAELNKGVAEVLGYKCDELILTCKSGIQKYYFNSGIVVNPDNFKLHKYGNWYDYLSRSKALPLKSVIENAECVIEQQATNIKEKKIEDSLFELPLNAETAPSPY